MNFKTLSKGFLTLMAFSVPSLAEDLSDKQGYRLGTVGSERGINLEWAWEQGYKGQGVHIADVEMAWDLEHDDLKYKSIGYHNPSGIDVDLSSAEQHGTNVLGILFAEDNGWGMTGLAVESSGSVWNMFGETVLNKPGMTIRAAADSLEVGDILQLELSTSLDEQSGPGPAEIRRENWEAIKYAVDKGIVVLAAAGNGGENLDASKYDDYRSWGDNGATLVGAGLVNQERSPISTYGSKVHVQAWGDTVVATTGTYEWQGVTKIEGHHGVTLGNTKHQAFSYQFSGTSSALPIVAGAAAIIQSYAKTELGKPLNSREMRELLIRTGSAQDTSRLGGHIGPIPDVEAAIKELASSVTAISAKGMTLSYSEGWLLNPKQSQLELRVLDVHGKLLLTHRSNAKNVNMLNLLSALSDYKGRVIIDIRNRSHGSSLKIMDLSI